MYEEDRALIEAILFLEVEPLSLERLVRIARLDLQRVQRIVTDMEREFAETSHRGICIKRIDDRITFSPSRGVMERLAAHYGRKGQRRLTRATVETLAIVAYSQPITRGEIESIRGVSVDNALRTLVETKLVDEKGTKEAPGRPILYGTTREFLRRFGLQSIAELPKLDPIEEQRFIPWRSGK